MSEDLSWTLKSAAGLLPAAQQVLRVHGVAGRHGMLSLSQSAQVRIGALPAMRSDDPDYASNCALVAPCSAVRNLCDVCWQTTRSLFLQGALMM